MLGTDTLDELPRITLLFARCNNVNMLRLRAGMVDHTEARLRVVLVGRAVTKTLRRFALSYRNMSACTVAS